MEKIEWYHKPGYEPHNQAQVIDVKTGETVAVTYNDPDGKRAALMAAAPELLETLEGVKNALSRMIDKHDPDSIEAEWIGNAREVIYKIQNP